MSNTLISLPRRQLLAGSASALAAVGLASWTRGALPKSPLRRPLNLCPIM